jgi:sialate O-acetylesterase
MWRVELPPTAASTTPENITVTGLGSTVTLANVLFGDVWMCGGQSNMAVPLDETFEWFHPSVANDTDYPIHILEFPHITGLNTSTIHVQADSPIPWLNSTYDHLTSFSAVCYYFGKALHKRLAAGGRFFCVRVYMWRVRVCV